MYILNSPGMSHQPEPSQGTWSHGHYIDYGKPRIEKRAAATQQIPEKWHMINFAKHIFFQQSKNIGKYRNFL